MDNMKTRLTTLAGLLFAAIVSSAVAFAHGGHPVKNGYRSHTPNGLAPSYRRAARPVFSHPTQITNRYVPLSLLHQDILEGTDEGKAARVERTRKPGVKVFMIDGKRVPAMIVEDREFANGRLIEIALDYFAQADDGTVYYMGEDVNEYKNGRMIGHEGAWLSGPTIPPGVMMPAHPRVGAEFQLENVPHVTREDDRVDSMSETVTVPAGTYHNCIKVSEKLDTGEVEYKYYAPGVGVVREVPRGGDVTLRSHR